MEDGMDEFGRLHILVSVSPETVADCAVGISVLEIEEQMSEIDQVHCPVDRLIMISVN